MKKPTSTFIAWLPMAAAIVCIYGIVYLGIQQSIRSAANELPAQYATEVKNRLEKGMTVVEAIADMPKVDMAKSLSPFVIVYDHHEQPVAGTARLDTSYPTPPGGVLNVVKKQKENRVTWQPRRNVRNATVILACKVNGRDGFVLAGKSLREAEARVRIVGNNVLLGMIVTLAATFVMMRITKSERAGRVFYRPA